MFSRTIHSTPITPHDPDRRIASVSKFEEIVFAIVRFIAKIITTVAAWVGIRLVFCDRLSKARPERFVEYLGDIEPIIYPVKPRFLASEDEQKRVLQDIFKQYEDLNIRTPVHFLKHAISLYKPFLSDPLLTEFNKEIGESDVGAMYRIGEAAIRALVFTSSEVQKSDIKNLLVKTGTTILSDVNWRKINRLRMAFRSLPPSEQLTIIYHPQPNIEDLNNICTGQPLSQCARGVASLFQTYRASLLQGYARFAQAMQNTFPHLRAETANH